MSSHHNMDVLPVMTRTVTVTSMLTSLEFQGVLDVL